MDESEVLEWLSEVLPVGDDCYVFSPSQSDLLFTIDMLHESTDFPDGLSDYSIGWRSTAVTISDIAAMGGKPRGILIAYGVPEFREEGVKNFLRGAEDLCGEVGAEIVGGDLDRHREPTVVTAGVGEVSQPVLRAGARPGDLVGMTGELGKTAVALELFRRGEDQEADRLFRFTPRVVEGLQLREFATSMMDISDGLARSLHQLAAVNGVGFDVTYEKISLHPKLQEVASGREETREMALFTGDDYELLFTAPPEYRFEVAKAGGAVIGEVVEGGLTLQIGGETLPIEDSGYVH